MAARNSAWRSGEIPRSPAISSTGSPGTSRISAKVSRVTPMKVGMIRLNRVRKKRNMGQLLCCGKAGEFRCWAVAQHRFVKTLVDIHAVEDVPAERIDLVVLHFFPDRLIDDRVSHRDPGRLFLEDDL